MNYMARYVENHTRTVELYVEIEKKGIEPFISFLKDTGYIIISLERRRDDTIFDGDIALRVEFDMLKRKNHADVMDELLKLEHVHYIEEIS